MCAPAKPNFAPSTFFTSVLAWGEPLFAMKQKKTTNWARSLHADAVRCRESGKCYEFYVAVDCSMFRKLNSHRASGTHAESTSNPNARQQTQPAATAAKEIHDFRPFFRLEVCSGWTPLSQARMQIKTRKTFNLLNEVPRSNCTNANFSREVWCTPRNMISRLSECCHW